MEEFKKKMWGRQILLLGGLLGLCVALIISRQYEKAPPASDFLSGFAAGFQTGIVLALVSCLVFFFVRNVLALRDPERLKRLYISETDERKRLIRQKSGSDGMILVLYGLATGAAAAANCNDTVFFTLLGACLFVSVVRGFLKVYYRSRY